MWNKLDDTTSKDIKSQTVGYDNLKAAIEDCTDCAVSDFEAWQESVDQQDKLFQQSYIGRGGEEYVAWKTAQNKLLNETSLGMTATGSYSASMDLSTTEAQNTLRLFELELTKANPTLAIKAWVQRKDYDDLISEIAQPHIMPVTVDISANAGQIVAIVEAAIASALAGM